MSAESIVSPSQSINSGRRHFVLPVWLARQIEVEFVSPLPLAVFRFFFGLASLGQVVDLWVARHLIFDTIPYQVSGRLSATPLLIAWAVSLSLVTVGYYTRPAAIVSFVLSAAILGVAAVQSGYSYHADTYLLSGALLLCFSPSSEVLAVDAWRTSRVETPLIDSFWYFAIAAVLGCAYFDAAVWKLNGPIWRAGLGFWAPTSIPGFTYLNLKLLGGPAWLVRAMGYLVVAYEVSFIFLIWSRHLRPWIVGLGIFFHAGIALAFPIPLFGLLLCVFLIPLAPTALLERWFAPIERYGRKLAAGRRNRCEFRPDTDRVHSRPSRRGPAFKLSFVAVMFGATLLYFPKAAGFHSRPYNIFVSYLARVLYPLTGIDSHPVFVDELLNYHVETRLAFREPGMVERSLNLVDEKGHPKPILFERVWCMWLFRTVGPTLPRAVVEHELSRFIAFATYRSNIDLDRGAIVIYQRSIDNRAAWEPDLAGRNESRAWTEVGTARVPKDGDFAFSWKKPCWI